MESEAPLLHVEFFTEPHFNQRLTDEAGHAVYEDLEYVRIKFPGDSKRVHVARADECAINHPETGSPWSYMDRFPAHYQAFKDNAEYAGPGTPLSELPFLSKAQVKTMQGQNVHTVETLVALDGSALETLGMGAQGWKQKAQAYLDRAANAAVDNHLMQENAELKERLQRLEAMMADGAGEQLNSASPSPFQDWDVEQIKTWIKEATGSRPNGNPKHETLVAMADKINADLAKQEAAA